MKDQNLEKIKSISNAITFHIDKLNVVYIASRSFLFINNWARKFKIPLSTGFRLKLSTFIGIVLQQYYTYDAMIIFFRGIAIQRYWDNLYDDNNMSDASLKILRNKINDKNEVARDPLLRAHDDFMDNLLKTSSLETYDVPLVKKLESELLSVLDAYEFERELSIGDNEITREDIEAYKFHSTNSVALKYTFLLLGISLITSEEEYTEFQETFEMTNDAAWSIRLANDIEGHKRELMEGKKDYITLMTSLERQTEDEIVSELLEEINLITKKISSLNDSKFNVLLKRITFLAVGRYLNNNF